MTRLYIYILFYDYFDFDICIKYDVFIYIQPFSMTGGVAAVSESLRRRTTSVQLEEKEGERGEGRGEGEGKGGRGRGEGCKRERRGG